MQLREINTKIYGISTLFIYYWSYLPITEVNYLLLKLYVSTYYWSDLYNTEVI